MGFSAEPIRLRPRFLPRRWGREKLDAWCANADRPPTPVGEVWLAHAHNTTSHGDHFGATFANAPQEMLGDLGRAPPSLRLVATDEPSDPIRAEGPVTLWRIIEAPLDASVTIRDRAGRAPRQVRCRRGDLLRLSHGAELVVPSGVTALEARASFAPSNQPGAVQTQRLPAANEKRHRAAWLRDPAMSVELWTLPDVSFLEPDGETCHVLAALTPGVSVDGQMLARGEAIFLPAEGRRVTLSGRGAQVVVAYPDLVPTEIWKHPQPPTPAARALDLAEMKRMPVNIEAYAASALRVAA